MVGCIVPLYEPLKRKKINRIVDLFSMGRRAFTAAPAITA
jgi:hypothetical protein